MLTQEELEKTEGWRLLMEAIDRKYGKSDAAKSQFTTTEMLN